MRIIGGTFARLRIDTPKGLKLRPTTDMAKEALFSSLASMLDFEDINVLDLFSGTGSIAFEFISRGAAYTLMIEKQYKHAAFIKSVIAKLKVEHCSAVRTDDVQRFLKQATAKGCDALPLEKGRAFDVVFADPPYDLPWLSELPQMVLNSGLLASNAIFILEHPSTLNFSEHPCCFKHKQYSAVNFSFFTAEAKQ